MIGENEPSDGVEPTVHRMTPGDPFMAVIQKIERMQRGGILPPEIRRQLAIEIIEKGIQLRFANLVLFGHPKCDLCEKSGCEFDTEAIASAPDLQVSEAMANAHTMIRICETCGDYKIPLEWTDNF
jgi:hypothetical protein